MRAGLLIASVAFLATSVGLGVRLYQVTAQNRILHEDLEVVMGASTTPDPCIANLAKVTNSPAFVSCKAGAFVVLRRQ